MTTGPSPSGPVPVFFLSDSTGISAETMGNALLIQFPDLHFERRLFPFITSVEEARRVVAVLDCAMEGPVTPLAFSTTAAIAKAFVKPWTYYRVDAATMFQTATHTAVLEVIDSMTSAQNLRALPEMERKPTMREFFQHS